jgi:hypothetical protein
MAADGCRRVEINEAIGLSLFYKEGRAANHGNFLASIDPDEKA